MMPAALVVMFCAVAWWAIGLPVLRDNRRCSPDSGSSQPGSSDQRRTAGAADVHASAPGWLQATLPVLPQQPRLVCPRLCAGRVATLQRVVTLCDPAGWPVASYAAGVRWPLAPEVVLCT